MQSADRTVHGRNELKNQPSKSIHLALAKVAHTIKAD